MYWKVARHFYSVVKRNCSSACIYKKEFPSTVFCNLEVQVPFDVDIKPLDVHVYPNCDKLIVKLFSKVSDSTANVRCIQKNGNILLTADSSDDNIKCFIETSVKSNLHISTTGTGSINVRHFNGDKVILRSVSGNITSEKCQCSLLNYISGTGDITTHGTLHAADIYLRTEKNGGIHVNHMQGLNTYVETENGDINIKSSYCDNTSVSTLTGNLFLENMHKKCTIISKCGGTLKLTGFDGCLIANLEQGNIDAQLSKLSDESKIQVKEKGNILLRLSEWVQENTELKILCTNLHTSQKLTFGLNTNDRWKILLPKSGACASKLLLDSNLCKVQLEAASWSDVLKVKGIHLSD